MKLVLILLTITSFSAFAFPKKLEVWFLSLDKSAFLNEVLPKIQYSKKLAQNYQCQPMGEYCFDPQIGLYKKNKDNSISKAQDYSFLDSKESFDKEGDYKEGEYDPCKNPGHFNIFCGNKSPRKKEKPKPGNKLEMWVDISSTMKQIDFKGYTNACYRETFLKSIHKVCPLNKKMKIYIFDENRKELGNFDRVCISNGLNRVDRLMRDIKASNAENLIIITDIYEAKADFIDFIEREGKGIVKGIENPLYARNILNDVSRVQGMCK